MRATARQDAARTEDDLRKAVKLRLPVTVDYLAEDGTHTVRTIEPHEVRVTKNDEVIIVAMCRMRLDRRTFRMDRITHYTLHRGTFQLQLPAPADPNEVTDWWTVRSRNGHEILQVHVNTDGQSNPYRLVLAEAIRQSGQVRAVSKAEGGVSLRRLRRRDVIAPN